MSWNGSGTFTTTDGTRTTNVLTKQKAAGLKIVAANFDLVLENIAAGLNNCLTKDGQNSATANIAMGDSKITGLANGTSSSDAVNKSQLDTKLNLSGGTMSGPISMGNSRIEGLAAGTANEDAVRLGQVVLRDNTVDITPVAVVENGLKVPTTGQVFSRMPKSGGTFTGNITFASGVGLNNTEANCPINMGNNNKIINLSNGANPQDAVTKSQLDAKLGLSGGSMSGAIDMNNSNINGVGALVADTGNPITMQLSSSRSTTPIYWLNSTATGLTGAIEVLRISQATSDSTADAYLFINCTSSGSGDQEFYVTNQGNVRAEGSITGGGADYAITLKKTETLEYGDLVTLKNGAVSKAVDGDKVIGVVRPKEGISHLENDLYRTTSRGDFDEYIDGVRTRIKKELESKSEKEPEKYCIVGILGLLPVKKDQSHLVPKDWILYEERETANVYLKV